MKKIKLTKGKFAIVDDEDYLLLNRHKWTISNGHPAKSFSKHQLLMSHLVYPIGKGRGRYRIYFKNHNPLDLRKENIELRNYVEHTMGQPPRVKTSIYKGVCWSKANGKWEVSTSKRIDGKRKKFFIGYFNDEEEGALAYNNKVKELFGESAYQNVIK